VPITESDEAAIVSVVAGGGHTPELVVGIIAVVLMVGWPAFGVLANLIAGIDEWRADKANEGAAEQRAEAPSATECTY
jgi:hypothetical protein